MPKVYTAGLVGDPMGCDLCQQITPHSDPGYIVLFKNNKFNKIMIIIET